MARVAKGEHQRATGSALTAIQYAVRAGEALFKARELRDVGEWGDFIASRFTNIIAGDGDQPDTTPTEGRRDARVASPEKPTPQATRASLPGPMPVWPPSANSSIKECAPSIGSISELRSHTPVTYHVAEAIRLVEGLRTELASLASVSVEQAKAPPREMG